MEVNIEELKSFILEASRATYASGDESIKEKQADGSTTIRYENGPYRFHDNYFGGEPYGGREVVFLKDKPIWMMVYYGLVHGGSKAKEFYPFLMASLSHATLEMPFRGPETYVKDSLSYENKLDGTAGQFSGIEKIYQDNRCVYEASYIGGLVDR